MPSGRWLIFVFLHGHWMLHSVIPTKTKPGRCQQHSSTYKLFEITASQDDTHLLSCLFSSAPSPKCNFTETYKATMFPQLVHFSQCHIHFFPITYNVFEPNSQHPHNMHKMNVFSFAINIQTHPLRKREMTPCAGAPLLFISPSQPTNKT